VNRPGGRADRAAAGAGWTSNQGWKQDMLSEQELAWADATDLARLVRQGEVTPLELVEAAIGRIERLNPRINAVVTPMFDQARKKARGPLPDGPFTGVPFLLKDLLAAYRGVRLTAGSKALTGFVPNHDSELVSRLKKSGLIVLGKTNTAEFGLMPTTEPHLFGPARNPWDTTRTPGGSSGGSAAAVAAGLVPLAHGNDGGGSIRIPASCCGLFGLKPTRARNPMGPGFGDVMSGLVIEHGLTRSVRDSAALLDATAGPGQGDPYVAPPPARPFAREVGADPGRLRIAFSTKPLAETPVHADCLAAAEDAARLCADLGHEVFEAAPEIDNAENLGRVFGVLWTAGLAWTIQGVSRATGRPIREEDYEPLTWALYQKGITKNAADYLTALQTAQAMSRQMAAFMAGVDVWLTPTLAQPPLTLGALDSTPDDPLRGWPASYAFAPFTAPCNVTGQPAMSVPLYWSAQGLPIGAHFIGRYGDEATLFRLASQLETARPWGDRRPPISI
jgi:amidase